MSLKARIESGIVYSPYPSEAPQEISLYRALKECLEQHGDRTAVVFDDEEITFRELLKMLQRYAAGFQGQGIRKGDKVLVHLENSLETLIAMYSVVFAGAVVVLSELAWSNEDIISRIRHSNATYVLTSANEAYRFSAIRDKLVMKGFFTTGTAPGFVSVTQFKNLNENTYKEIPVEDVKKEAIVIFYTSGTTGVPKAVVHTHYSMVSSMARPRFDSIFTSHDIFASPMNVASSTGFRIYLQVTSAGAKAVVFTSSPDENTFLDIIRKHKVNFVFTNISMLLRLGRRTQKEDIRLDCLKTVMIAAVHASEQTLGSLEQSFDLATVKNAYGSSELGVICRPTLGRIKAYGIGFPASMAKIKIVDIKSGNVLGPNEEGELYAKSPSSMTGYYENPEATSQVLTPDGWVRTGDICYYNEDGQFFFVARMSQLFRCKGILVAPSVIESVLLSHEGIAEASVIGVPHKIYVEAAKAFVMLKASHSNITEAELQTFVAGKLGVYMHLHGGVKFVDSIPKDGNDKVKRMELLALDGDD